jgi:hypothetical protein
VVAVVVALAVMVEPRQAHWAVLAVFHTLAALVAQQVTHLMAATVPMARAVVAVLVGQLITRTALTAAPAVLVRNIRLQQVELRVQAAVVVAVVATAIQPILVVVRAARVLPTVVAVVVRVRVTITSVQAVMVPKARSSSLIRPPP